MTIPTNINRTSASYDVLTYQIEYRYYGCLPVEKWHYVETEVLPAARSYTRMVRSNAKNDSHSLSKAEKIEGFRRLCKEQFTLIMDSVSSVLDQMRLVRVLEAMGEEAQVTFPEVFLKLKKLIVKLNQLFQIMQNYCDN